MDTAVVAGLLSVIAVLVVALVTSLPSAIRNKTAESTISLFERQNAELRQQINDQEHRHADRIAAYKAQVDELSGKVSVLTDHFTEAIADSVATKVLARMHRD